MLMAHLVLRIFPTSPIPFSSNTPLMALKYGVVVHILASIHGTSRSCCPVQKAQHCSLNQGIHVCRIWTENGVKQHPEKPYTVSWSGPDVQVMWCFNWSAQKVLASPAYNISYLISCCECFIRSSSFPIFLNKSKKYLLYNKNSWRPKNQYKKNYVENILKSTLQLTLKI